ncbi:MULTISPECIES: SAM-dependent methyltransferase [Sphingobacterium]|jgi:16S rRNA (cytidine1402-2'-O)-methyltransferase|uniref:SAM-dependent methyltransferase n=2 Tax=Sphingobacterium TaxID=28453 RepID=A0ACD5BX23_9SPHI|nr:MULTISPECIES: SAM-dependent methyltransferase [Sphingobacterium]HAF36912.1 SAM-dependent methyltransferase [Sphingobacterium sp.]OFV18509.1 SAM-dependent methyltransferase [Sphingobacterium sp. HMSC13C05]OJZ13361.1 MAG: SAM-dependent methyltransferase [Sphingobacterium sp. 40-24]QQT43412.1 SAM-dependent methyltransferase [Sphingobacterium multivorum]QQT63752.1 SAM-dependent methyltransferase [Sphingobacterium multivorum]
MANGILYLIPVPLSDDAAFQSFTPYLVETINSLDEYIVENEKTARKFLKLAGLKIPQSELTIHDYGKHVRDKGNINDFFEGLKQGKSVGLMSEAGCPGVADPGASIVARAHQLGIKVVPLVGPSSILLALMASGFSGQKFAFHGYLPIDKIDRAKEIKNLEQQSAREKQTQIFIETPFRNNQLLADLLKICKPSTLLCVASNVTAADENIQSLTVGEWRKRSYDYHKKPTIFLLYA